MADDQEQARRFFEHYRSLLAQYDASVASLYADDALIRTDRYEADGSFKVHEVRGEAFRRLLPGLSVMAQLKGSRNNWVLRRVEQAGRRITLYATRISPDKCYSDPAYRMVIERQEDGRWLIVEERTRSQSFSSCPAS